MCENLEFQKATVIEKRMTGSQFQYLVINPGRHYKIVYPGWYRSVPILDEDHNYTQNELQAINENLRREVGEEIEWIEIIPEFEAEYT